MNGTYWDLFDSLHKDLSVYFFNWYFDRPMVISKERDMELHRVQQLLAKCLHFYADHYEEYLDLIPYDEKIQTTMRNIWILYPTTKRSCIFWIW